MDNTKPTKENILNDICIINKEIGFINNKIYLEKGKYSYNQIRRVFGNLSNALEEFNKLNVSINLKDIDNKQINKQELFNLASELFEKNNYITEGEFFSNMNISINKFDKTFGSFTNFLKEANLYDKFMIEFSKKQSLQKKQYYKNNSNKIFDFTKTEAIMKGNELFKLNGEITKTSYLKYTNYDTKTFLNMFNTFTDFLKEANLYEQMRIINNSKKGSKNNNFYNGNNKIKNFSKKDCFNIAKEILISESDLTKDIFFEKSNYDKKIFLNMFDNSFRSFIKESGLYNDIKKIRDKKNHQAITITKEELIDKIFDFIKINNIDNLKANDLYSNTDITQNQIKKYWSSFSEMKKELNLEKKKENLPSKEEVINHMWYLYNINNNKLTSTIQRRDGKYEKKIIDKLFGSFSNMLIEMGLNINMPRNISSEELLNDLKLIVEKHGTINSILIDNEGKYSRPTYLSRLGGSIPEICKYLNIIYANTSNSCISNSGRYCIYLFSEIFNDKNYTLEQTFDWLINPETGSKMRLDGYFPNLKVAIEYDGIQHYEYTPKLDKTYESFLKRQERDKIKNQLCEKNNIKLIRVKYDEPLNIEYLKKKIL